MSTVKINSGNDIELVNNDLSLLTGREEIAQVLRQELRVFAGEWFLDRRKGVPYFQDILRKAPNPARIDAIFKDKILSSPGVIELIEFSIELEGRSLRLAFKARSTDGIITFDEVLI